MTYNVRTDGSESTGPDGIYLVWYYGWSGLEVDECASLQEALIGYESLTGSDYYTLRGIEGPEGVVSAAEIHAWCVAEDARQSANTVRSIERMNGRVRFEVQLRVPDGNQAVEFSAFDHLDEAVAELGRLNRPGRTRIVMQVFRDRRWETERIVIDWGTAEEGQVAA